MTLYSQAESNSRKTWLYLSFFLVFVIATGWLVSYFLQSQIVLYAAVALSFITSFFSYWYSDKIVLKMSRAKPVSKSDNPELYRLVENLCITAGLPMPKIYLIDESQPNAFATGRDPERAVIAVTRGLLEKLERAELEGVIAHELAHIGNRDILLSTIIVVLVGMVVIMTDFFFRLAFWGRAGGRGRGDGRLQLVIMAAAIALALLAPLLATMLKLAVSRKREFLADASGALLTRYPEGLASALEKISRSPERMKSANDATAHLFIASPFRAGEKKKWLHKLFMTHPPTEERVAALRGMKT